MILMADDIRSDKITLREKVRESLGRLMSQNYIGRTGDTYNFLTDEEQDIQRDIKNIPVDTANIVEHIAHIIFGDIYTARKYRYGKYDFAFDQMVDGVMVGPATGGMGLRFLTVATDAAEKSELRLITVPLVKSSSRPLMQRSEADGCSFLILSHFLMRNARSRSLSKVWKMSREMSGIPSFSASDMREILRVS